MKWLPAAGSTQHSADGRYCIVQANSQHWIAYKLTPYATGEQLDIKPTDSEARTVCDSHEATLYAKRTA